MDCLKSLFDSVKIKYYSRWVSMWVTKLVNYFPFNYCLQISSPSTLSLPTWKGLMTAASPGAPKIVSAALRARPLCQFMLNSLNTPFTSRQTFVLKNKVHKHVTLPRSKDFFEHVCLQSFWLGNYFKTCTLPRSTDGVISAILNKPWRINENARNLQYWSYAFQMQCFWYSTLNTLSA